MKFYAGLTKARYSFDQESKLKKWNCSKQFLHQCVVKFSTCFDNERMTFLIYKIDICGSITILIKYTEL